MKKNRFRGIIGTTAHTGQPDSIDPLTSLSTSYCQGNSQGHKSPSIRGTPKEKSQPKSVFRMRGRDRYPQS